MTLHECGLGLVADVDLDVCIKDIYTGTYVCMVSGVSHACICSTLSVWTSGWVRTNAAPSVAWTLRRPPRGMCTPRCDPGQPLQDYQHICLPCATTSMHMCSTLLLATHAKERLTQTRISARVWWLGPGSIVSDMAWLLASRMGSLRVPTRHAALLNHQPVHMQ